ncbi:ABC transporter substrate-binding protein [Rugosimonospora africana]|nr:ABC transporter substrate-binding protein [Rugosimonospora africana]
MRVGTGTRPTRPGLRRRLAAAVLGCGVAAAIVSIPTPSVGASSGSTFTIAMDDSGIDTLNPFLSYFEGGLKTFALIYPTLNILDEDNKPGPYLATSWTTSPDQLTWTYKIQSGLKWSDGQPITAEDAAWTFNLIMTNNIAATANGALVANVASVTAPDATTLVIKTKQPQANMLYISVPHWGIPIVPKHIWESHVAGLKDYKNDTFPVVGYGPYTLVNYTTDQYEKFAVNKDFKLGGKSPTFDNLVVQEFKNSDAAVAALKSNQLAYYDGLNSNQFNALKNDSSLRTFQELGTGWTAVEINAGAKTRTGKPIGTGNPALANDQVREAISYAIDKKKITANVLGGLGVSGEGYLPPGYPQWQWHPSADEAVSYNPAKANSLLDSAGYAKGPDGVRIDPRTHKPLSIRLGIHSDSSRDAQISALLQGWLKDVGIDLKLDTLSMSKLNDNLAKGDWDMLMDSWPTGPDPTYLLSIQTCGTLPKDDGTGGNTDAFVCDPNYDKLFAQQVNTFDATQRAQLVGQMQDILYKANRDLILYYPNGLVAYRKDALTGITSGKADANGFYPSKPYFWFVMDAAPLSQKASSSHRTTYLVAGAVVVVLIAAGAVLLLRRRSTADERE